MHKLQLLHHTLVSENNEVGNSYLKVDRCQLREFSSWSSSCSQKTVWIVFALCCPGKILTITPELVAFLRSGWQPAVTEGHVAATYVKQLGKCCRVLIMWKNNFSIALAKTTTERLMRRISKKAASKTEVERNMVFSNCLKSSCTHVASLHSENKHQI